MSGYIELHCHSNFSLLDGASHPEELVAQAAALEMPALALTDHDAVYGAIRFIEAARAHDLQPILGTELSLANPDAPDDPHHLTLLVTDQAGWHNLCYLISRARINMPKGEALLPPDELVGCTQGLIALSGCRRGALARALRRRDREAAVAQARHYQTLFGSQNFYIELQRHFLPGEDSLVASLAALASYLNLACVVTNNAHYATPERARLQDVLVCIRHLTTLDAATHLRRFNSEYYLKSPAQMAALFPDHARALSQTRHLAERCQFELDYGLQDLPTFPTPHGMSSSAYLRRLCLEALTARYPAAAATVRRQLAHELQVIEAAGLANYFLIVADIVRFAREEAIRCQGRGSAANSLVAYLLHISPIDPLAHDLVFERFLSPERQVVPDIDIDFDAARREEVIQYLYDRYGPAHTAMACTFVTFRRRSALRDVGKALGLSPQVIAAAMEALDGEPADLRPDDERPVALLLDLCRQIDGFPRHLGIHSGGMIITGSPLMSRVPTEPATMPERVVVQWDKESLEDVGLVKIDILGLRMLSAISETLSLIGQTDGQVPDLAALTADDPAVYAMISQSDTLGVFQVESRAQTQMLPKLQPRNFADLVVAISLIRPGPIQGNMVHPYLRRRQGSEAVSYEHPLLEPALAETLGVILFQEQVLKVARDLAGFTAGQGELLRRALGSKRGTDRIERLRESFLEGAAGQGVSRETAQAVFDQLRAFGGYSFAKSHAAAFAVLVYQSAWLKRYYFAHFYTALLNNQPMGFWTPAVLVNEAQRQGVVVRPVDVNQSEARCAVVEGGIRLGFNYVSGLGEAAARIILARADGTYQGLADFCRRTRIPRRLVENLIAAGGFDAWEQPRRQLLWELGRLAYQEEMLALEYPPETPSLPALTPAGAMMMEHAVLGLSTGDHVMTLYRDRLRAAGILSTRQARGQRNGQRIELAGLMVVHQAPPTAKGFHFLTLEDETGLVDVVVRPGVYGRYRQVVQSTRLLRVKGVVERQEHIMALLAVALHPL